MKNLADVFLVLEKLFWFEWGLKHGIEAALDAAMPYNGPRLQEYLDRWPDTICEADKWARLDAVWDMTGQHRAPESYAHLRQRLDLD